jgi:hypothetical protein
VNLADTHWSRRTLLKSAAVVGGLAALGHAVPAFALGATENEIASTPEAVPPALLKRALAALNRNAARIPHRDRMVVVDFSTSSARRRLHVVDLVSGQTTSMLVAHGRGSDPAHTGWLQRFSNQPGSNASSQGAYLTSDYYTGQHGHSQRLVGLDPTNDNALARAIVIHAAWYAEPEMIPTHRMLGRSEGCFAVGEAQLSGLFGRLGEGRMIYADKV